MIIKQKILGHLQKWQDRVVVWLSASAAEDAQPSIYLSYAFVTMGREEHVLPSFLLDDWGNEVKSLKLYYWVREFGEQFPRAELFCYGLDGESRQHFLREFELYVPYPCYAFSSKQTPLAEARRVTDFVVVNSEERFPRQIAGMDLQDEIKFPLRRAAGRWWSVPAAQEQLDFLATAKVAIGHDKAE